MLPFNVLPSLAIKRYIKEIDNWNKIISITLIRMAIIRNKTKMENIPLKINTESQGLGSLVGCCLWGCTELDTTEVT